MAVRTRRDNGCPVGDFGREPGFENRLQRRLWVGGIVFPRAPNDAAHERDATDVHSGKWERQLAADNLPEPLFHFFYRGLHNLA